MVELAATSMLFTLTQNFKKIKKKVGGRRSPGGRGQAPFFSLPPDLPPTFTP
jgi:hypothetical protein